MSRDNTVLMTCDWCGKDFPATPDACVESGICCHIEGEELCENDFLNLLVSSHIDPRDISDEDRENMKEELELDDDQLDTLLSTGRIDGLASIVCPQCQDESIVEEFGEE